MLGGSFAEDEADMSDDIGDPDGRKKGEVDYNKETEHNKLHSSEGVKEY